MGSRRFQTSCYVARNIAGGLESANQFETERRNRSISNSPPARPNGKAGLSARRPHTSTSTHVAVLPSVDAKFPHRLLSSAISAVSGTGFVVP